MLSDLEVTLYIVTRAGGLYLEEGLGPGSRQLLLQLSQALGSAAAAPKQIRWVVQVPRGVEGHSLLPVLGLTALLALLLYLHH